MIVGEAQPAGQVTDEPVRLHALTYLEEDGEVVAGRADTDSYGLFPPDGAALLQKLETGVTSRDAAQWYQATYSEPVDMAEFLDTLDELGFLVKPGEAPVVAAPVRWQRLGAWMFSPAAWACYVLIVGAAGAAIIVHPRLLPHPGNLFFTRYMAILELGRCCCCTRPSTRSRGGGWACGRRWASACASITWCSRPRWTGSSPCRAGRGTCRCWPGCCATCWSSPC